MSPLTRIERRWFAPMPRRSHDRLVAALALVLGVRLATGSYRHLSDLPDAMYEPPWFLAWSAGPPGPAVLVAIQVVGVVAAGTVLLARGRHPGAFALAWGALLVLAGVETSGGKILHNQVLLLLSCMPFLVPPRPPAHPVPPEVGEATAPGQDLVEGWHHRTAMVLAALGYVLAGSMKLRHSGLAWVTSDNLRWVLYAGARSPGSVAPELARWIADRAWLATTVAAGTLTTELLFPLAVVVRRLRVVLALAAVSLHVGVHLTLGLDYWSWVAVVVILFLPWQRLLDRGVLRAATSRRATSPSG